MKIVIVGGVAGGATAATRLRRLSEENEVIIFERGEFISFANCGLPYHIGGTIKKRDALLLQTPESLKDRFNLDVRVFSEVTKIDKEKKSITVQNVQTGEVYEESYDKLLLSPGANPIKPPFEGIESSKILTLRNIPDMDKIISKAKEAEDFVVVGGGFIGLEVAENLIESGKKVRLVELSNQVMAPVDYEIASFIHHKAKEKGLELLLETGVEKFKETEKGIEVFLNNGTSINTDAVILAIGVRPENQLAKEIGLEIGKTGGIVVNEYGQTSDKDIYAVGDAIEVTHYINNQKVLIPLAWPANRQGRLVADNITLGHNHPYKGTLGSSILKFFELNVASTGLNEKQLKRAGIEYQTLIVTRGSNAGYYPGGKTIVLKLIFNKEGRIFGGQAVGEKGIDKRIDVLATAIKAGLNVRDLSDLELTYAPPFNSAKDPVNIAGYAAENILNDGLKMISYDQFHEYVRDTNAVVLDVRTKREFDAGAIEGAINIDVNNLRNELLKLDKSRQYVIYCGVGLRAYLAQRMMVNNGYKATNLSGGYSIWNKVY
ncbi:MAG: CoA-disulfide reductase [Candidatus Delongbacteria bacterium]|nr:MAG: CoA-disulfide reductase [Candidatus Delongbacteria bacterium]